MMFCSTIFCSPTEAQPHLLCHGLLPFPDALGLAEQQLALLPGLERQREVAAPLLQAVARNLRHSHLHNTQY